jgi:hypothetical protein
MTKEEVSAKHRWMFATYEPDEPRHPITFGHGLDIGPGWLALLDDALTQMGEEVRLMPPARRETFQIVQIKEKYGEICIYYHGGTTRMYAIVEEAERRSLVTCDKCGAPGLLREFSNNWFVTLCDTCTGLREIDRGLTSVIVRDEKEKSANMRDPDRIDVVLERLRAFWKKHPDWRLGQIMSNAYGAAGASKDIFFVEEDDFLKGLAALEKEAWEK